jgi:hypothetical protein
MKTGGCLYRHPLPFFFAGLLPVSITFYLAVRQTLYLGNTVISESAAATPVPAIPPPRPRPKSTHR